MNVQSTQVTLSKSGFDLMILEGQIAEEMRAIRRWARQEQEARANRMNAQSVLDAHMARIEQIKRGL